ncbi:tetratricopeptide repeat protein [Pseudoruegeria sp. SK021]|uniref:tetratricopeptide repeat protein n=1 Tax=Pseudoruegeria sp. SK021 TaxID=1933035 RepID=UPI00143DC6EE|nr:tetratricopeptide repeat protein [Pseudoruegeria sp. SK021]
MNEGDLDRAIVELKSVFKLDGENYDARMLYAELKQEQGDAQEAYGHYLLVSEQFPDDFPARLKLAEMAINLGAWDEAERHALAGLELQPDNPELAPILIAVRYAEAVRLSDQAEMEAEYALAQAWLKDNPGDTNARQVVLDKLVREQKPYAALDSVDEALELDPLNTQFNQTKLSLLAQLEDLEGLGGHLQTMVVRFPENQEVRTALVRWYLAKGDAVGAEQFVRELVVESGDDIEPRVALVHFLNQINGVDAAIAELDVLIEEGLDDDTFRLLRASLVFDKGDRDVAISQMQELVDGRSSDDVSRKMETTLARMLDATGQTEEAKELVAKVLAEDNTDVNALKLKAEWLISDDQVPDAVLALRTALDQSPRDSETITLLARAYERGGNRELMAESLALAYEASNAGAGESLRYATYLMQNEKYLTAEEVLLKSLRGAPGNVVLLRSLADTYLALNDLPRAEQVVHGMRQINTDDARNFANALEATILLRTSRTDESIQLLQSMVAEDSAGIGPQAAIIRTHLANGEIGNARLYMDELLAQATANGDESNPNLMFLNAALFATEGDYDQANTIYRKILDTTPELEAVWRALISTTVRQGDIETGEKIVDEALEVLPESANLLWIKAGLAEQNGEIDEAIAIYDGLYKADSNSTIVANNFASLLANYRGDNDSLQRAYVIARRLRGTTVPAFQDTYGWIAFRLSNYNEAVEYLEPAAVGLPNDPSVQYHLAKAYVAQGNSAEAIPYFQRAVDLWADTDLADAADARSELDRLSSAGSAPTATE